jgi:hypothetical protein
MQMNVNFVNVSLKNTIVYGLQPVNKTIIRSIIHDERFAFFLCRRSFIEINMLSISLMSKGNANVSRSAEA